MLTGVLIEIAEIAGEPAAVQIAASVGGTRVYFPRKADDDHWLVTCVGRAAADKICKTFTRAGQRVDVPLASGNAYEALKRAMAKRIHDLDNDKKSSAEIARMVGTTQRTVHRHRAAHRGENRKDKRQGSLF